MTYYSPFEKTAGRLRLMDMGCVHFPADTRYPWRYEANIREKVERMIDLQRRLPLLFAVLLALLLVSLLLTVREALLGYFHLPWGGRQMLPTLFHLNGALAGDPYARILFGLALRQHGHGPATFFGRRQSDRSFAVFNLSGGFRHAVCMGDGGARCRDDAFIYRRLNGDAPQLFSAEGAVLMSSCAVLIVLGESGVLAARESGGWSLPMFSLLAPIGATWLMGCAVVGMMLQLWAQPEQERRHALFPASCAVLGAASLFPVMPLLAVMILGQLALLDMDTFRPRLRQLLVLSAVWAAGCLYLVLRV